MSCGSRTCNSAASRPIKPRVSPENRAERQTSPTIPNQVSATSVSDMLVFFFFGLGVPCDIIILIDLLHLHRFHHILFSQQLGHQGISQHTQPLHCFSLL
eukprot:TRINITY_DN2875_c0_g1_i2.p2 TRINITY_DN2875_c0_g1~~TRINITY_DN2875_c0_g1_i2.p2  ORF type:complete len:100 (-),score=8.22 TRINITY_DN2875_c0_g1_i2:82-381(-)